MTPRQRSSSLTSAAICIWFGVLAAPAAYAAASDVNQPIRINARTVEANEKTGVAVYRGNVVIEQGRLSIRADRVEIRAHKNKTESIRATGKPAKLRQQADADGEEIDADADRIDYHVADGKLDMTGNVSLRRGADLFTGSALHYDLNTKILNAMGNDDSDGRVHAVIQPRKQTAETTPGPERP